jgi:AhpD family alkylhydroperoxidase
MTNNSILQSPAQPRLLYRTAAPAGFRAMVGLEQAVKASGLEHSLIELVKMRASQLNGCAFCMDMHAREAITAGEKPARLFLLSAWHEAGCFTPREIAAIRWTEALTRLTEGPVSDKLYAAVAEHFTEAELANLTLAVVAINGWNRFSVGFAVPPGFDMMRAAS